MISRQETGDMGTSEKRHVSRSVGMAVCNGLSLRRAKY
jgi:hypothetical protein